MYVIEDNSIYVTRGDSISFGVTAEDQGANHTFQAGDVLRLKVYGKKDAENVVLQKDFPVTEATGKVDIYLTEADTKFGPVISKPTDYWYEVELHHGEEVSTIVGYSEDGPAVFRLMPEGDDVPEFVPEEEDIPVVDDKLNMTSSRPVQNQAIAREMVAVRATAKASADATVQTGKALATERARIDNLLSGATVDSAEVVDIRVGANAKTYPSAGAAVREQILGLAKGFLMEDGFLDNQVRSHNLNNLETAAIGYYLSTNDEVIAMSELQAYTDYIPVREGEKYIARHPWGAQWSVSFYDKLKVLVAQQSYTEDTVVDTEKTNDSINTSYWHCVTIPEGVAYIRLNVGTSNPLNTMVVRGDSSAHIPGEYVAYDPEVRSEAFLWSVFRYVMETAGIINTEENTVLGKNALPISEGVKHNVAFGADALASIIVDSEADNQSGRYNVAVGGKAMKNTTTGNHNTACGFQAMLDNTTGNSNTAVGEDALMTNRAGNNNVAVGTRALQSATEGDYNVAVGLGAGYWNDTMHPSGSRNTMVGAHSGQADGDGSDNIALGYFAKAKSGLKHTIVIGNGTMATKDGQTIIGSSATKETVVRGDLVVMGTDEVKRQILFHADGTCSWINVT